MKLRVLGKESTPTNSPTVYAVEEDSAYIIQGWIIADAAVLRRHPIPDDEVIAEIPRALLEHFAKDGIVGKVSEIGWPIIDTLDNGNYVVRGKRVTDPEALAQMRIPAHETCLLVSKSSIVSLLASA